MKKLINRPDRVVDEMIEGFLALDPRLTRLSAQHVLIRSDAAEIRDRLVATISGGGSGHEPAHAGYVGRGMLTAAVAGEVFTSPSTGSVFAAIQACTGKAGALLIVKNYTGDRLNFGMASEMARAQGFRMEMVIVADDVALAASQENAGRRGLAGTVLMNKIAGAAAEEGKDLPQVAAIARAAAEDLGTMGLSLSAGTAPAVGKPSFTLGDEVELGLGIHGEPGVRRVPLQAADELTDQLLTAIVSTMRLVAGERIVALLNNLGATTAMELAIVARRTLSQLSSRGLIVERFYSGTFLSSLDMAGISISLLRVDDERLRRLDAPTEAPAWPNSPVQPPSPPERRTIVTASSEVLREPAKQTAAGRIAERAIRAACSAILVAEASLTEMDRVVGDGDLGVSLARGAKAVLEAIPFYPLDDTAATLRSLGLTLQEVLGGTSGPLYGVLLLRTGGALEGAAGHDRKSGDPKSWAIAIHEGCNAIGELGGARAGDRTMLDALIPFAEAFAAKVSNGEDLTTALQSAANAAGNGANRTAEMIARRGRSSYLGDRVSGHPDPGAMAVAIWIRAVVSAIAPKSGL